MKAEKIIVEASKAENTKLGVIGINPNKPDFGSIMLSTTSWDTSDGFANKTRRVHFLNGNVDTLVELVETFGLKAGDDYSSKVAPSKLIVVESTVPFYDGQAAKINPSTSEVIQFNGMDVYRQVQLVSAASAKMDKFIADTAVSSEAELTGADLPELN